jgi:hypothetical protein
MNPYDVEKGHIWGKQNGGRGDDADNFVTLTVQANAQMRSRFENKVKGYLVAGKTVCGGVLPYYEFGHNVPIEMVGFAVTSDLDIIGPKFIDNPIGAWNFLPSINGAFYDYHP